MAVLHGNWLVDHGFFLWGEAYRPKSPDLPKGVHPFVLEPEKLQHLLQDYGLKHPGTWLTQVVQLPTIKIKRSAQPLLYPERSDTQQPWRVGGFSLEISAAVKFLDQLPVNLFTESPLACDLLFWHQVLNWSQELIRQNKFLPSLVNSQEGWAGLWLPVLDRAADQNRLRQLEQIMPSVCLSYDSPRYTTPQQRILDFLQQSMDSQIRNRRLGLNLPVTQSIIRDWLASLTTARPVRRPINEASTRLARAITTWTAPVGSYLVKDDRFFLPNALCALVLEPPNSPEQPWRLAYALQVIGRPDLILSAAIIWQHPVAELVWQGIAINDPQETLLRGLGIAAKLYSPIAASLSDPQPTHCCLEPIQAYEFIKASAWRIQDHGLAIILPPSLRPGTTERQLGIRISASAPSETKHLGIQTPLAYRWDLAIGDQVISPQQLEQLYTSQSPLVEINGEWIALQPSQMRAAQAVIANPPKLQLTVADALRLSSGEAQVIEKLNVVQFVPQGNLAELLHSFTHPEAIAPIIPASFQGQLRPYQARGVGWLAFGERWGLGVCLADDMGLGKTIQAIAFFLHLQEQQILEKPILLVCPTSVLDNWKRECQRFAPQMRVLIHHGDQRAAGAALAEAATTYQVIITSYNLVVRDHSSLKEITWQGIVLDEAQNIKNFESKQSQAVRELTSKFRLALTGTPVENRLLEMWSIMDFLNPGYLGGRQYFQKRFALPIEKHGDPAAWQQLKALVRPLLLRRLKTDTTIISDLPAKQEFHVFCSLVPEQAALYQQAVDQAMQAIDTATGSKRRAMILTLLMRLKQICNHPYQYLKAIGSEYQPDTNLSKHSGKLRRLEEMLEEIIDRDRALVFTQFAELGHLIQPYLARRLGCEVLFLHGGTNRSDREAMVNRFQQDPQAPPVFILSLKAGGTGINLTRASHVFHFDRWWNPAVENQASDRAFRIGQTSRVQVYKFICSGTLEEKIHAIITGKISLAEQTVEAGENWLTELDTSKLREILLLDRQSVVEL